MNKATFQGLFNPEVNPNYSWVMPIKKMLYDLAAWVHRAVYTEIVTVTANTTLATTDTGKTFVVTADAKTISLPAALDGVTYNFINGGANGAVLITIDPNGTEVICGTTNASTNVALSQAAGKALLNTKATAIKGDCVTLVGLTGVGWIAKNFGGIWASEA